MTHTLRPGEYVALLNGMKIRYRIAGHGPVLMVQPPGWGVGAAIYESTFAPLERDFTLVYHDPRGSGASQVPEDAGTLHVAQYVADLEALRAHLGLESMALIGHSHGGLLALHYAASHPARVSHLLPVAAQVIGRVDEPGEAEDVVAMLSEDPAFAPALRTFHEESEEAIVGDATDERVTEFFRQIAPIYFRDQRHAGALTDYLAGNTLPARTVRETTMRDGEHPVMHRVGRIRAETLVLAGRFDLLCPAWVLEGVARAIPGAKFKRFDRSGHFPWVEEPDAFFAAVRGFLATSPLVRQ